MCNDKLAAREKQKEKMVPKLATQLLRVFEERFRIKRDLTDAVFITTT